MAKKKKGVRKASPKKTVAKKTKIPKATTQKHLAGVEPKDLPDLTALAKDYHTKLLQRMEWGRQEKTAKDALIAAMKEHAGDLKGNNGQLVYLFDDQKVVYEKSSSESVKIRSADSDE